MDAYQYDVVWAPKLPAEAIPRGLYMGEWIAAAVPGDTIANVEFTATFQGGDSDLDFADEGVSPTDPMVVLAKVSAGSPGDHLVTVTVTTAGEFTKIVEMTQTVTKP